MSTSRKYRAGAIGHTGHGEYGHELHLDYQLLPMTEMVAIADADPEGLAKGKSASGAQRGYADYREMLAKEQLDIVSVCPRQSFEHEAMIMACVDAGIRLIYSDKPLAPDLEACDRIIAACDRAGVKLAVAQQCRYVEPFLTARKMLEAGEIGDLVAMHARGKEDWRGGGEDTMVLGVHMTDLMRFFAGDPHWVFGRVTQDGRDVTKVDAWTPKEQNGLIAGDSITAMYAFDSGVVGHLVSRRCQHLRGDRWGFVLVGTKASLAIRFFMDMEHASVMRISHSGVPEEAHDWQLVEVTPEPIVPGSPPLTIGHPPTRGNRLAIADLIDAAENNREPIVNGRSGRWAVEMVMGIYASHLSGCRTAFPMADRKHPLAP